MPFASQYSIINAARTIKMRVLINGSWRPVKSRYQKPYTQIVVRIATAVGLSGTVKKTARRALVAGSRKGFDTYRRTITFSDKIIMDDEIGKVRGVTSLSFPTFFSTSTGIWRNEHVDLKSVAGQSSVRTVIY